jgi:putative spermidine/putrescine transport system substrate-binding protein
MKRLSSWIPMLAWIGLSACSGGGGGSPAASPSSALQALGASEGELVIVAPSGALERGDVDPRYDWVSAFEKESGCRVKAETVADSGELLARAAKGGADLVVAAGDASGRLIAGGQVQEINPALVPSWGKVDPRLQEAPWHTVAGRHYGVPLQWGVNLLVYDTTVFTEHPAESWGSIYAESKLHDGKPNQGRVGAYDSPLAIAEAALYLTAVHPELAIKDPYALNEAQYAAVLDVVRGQRKLAPRLWNEPAAQVESWKGSRLAVASSRQVQVDALKAAKLPVEGAVPLEGTTGWADTTMLLAKAAHPNCAYRWLEHTLNAKVQGDLAARGTTLPVIQAACDGNALLGEKGCADHGYDQFDRISFWRTPTADCGDGTEGCVPYDRWAADYAAIRAGR